MSPFQESRTLTSFRRLSLDSLGALSEMKGKLKGGVIVCLGTGPSIAKTDLGLLDGANVLFLNNAYRLANRFQPSYAGFVLTDYLRMMELRHEVRALSGDKFCSTDRIFYPFADVSLFDRPFLFLMPRHKLLVSGRSWRVKVITPGGFSDDITAGVFMGFSVVFSAIQIGAYLGAKRIVLVGIDMDYTGGGGAAYFDPTIKDNWPTFAYETHAREHFIEVRDALSTRGRHLVNATVGGRIDVLERRNLAEALSPVD
ncbi:hypothetical protein [Methylobacterium durans]|uniref:hypothetical protein n=1 Tax=Methylobacterium durans TaxID=2202825 RepID=UPI0013A587D3|nr:hypothetical protein [Methylobacterium durans]